MAEPTSFEFMPHLDTVSQPGMWAPRHIQALSNPQDAPRLPDQQILSALIRAGWSEEKARQVLSIPTHADPSLAHGSGYYYGPRPKPFVLVGTHNTWSNSQADPTDELLSHEYRHALDDVFVGGPGFELDDVRNRARSLSEMRTHPVAARASELTMNERPGDEIHWDHFIWNRSGRDMRRFPREYALSRLSWSKDLDNANKAPHRILIPAVSKNSFTLGD